MMCGDIVRCREDVVVSAGAMSLNSCAADMDALKTQYCQLRTKLRYNNAGPKECFEFMTAINNNIAEDEFEWLAQTVSGLREELSFQDAVTFLREYLYSLESTFCDRHPFFITDCFFMLVEDLEEQSKYLAAIDVLKCVLEWLVSHPCRSAEALTSAKLARLHWEIGSKPECDYFSRRAWSILHPVSYDDIFVTRGLTRTELTYTRQAFIEQGELYRVQNKADIAGEWFLRAFHCAEDDKIREYCVYTYLYQNEVTGDGNFVSIHSYEKLANTRLLQVLTSRQAQNLSQDTVRTIWKCVMRERYVNSVAEEINIPMDTVPRRRRLTTGTTKMLLLELGSYALGFPIIDCKMVHECMKQFVAKGPKKILKHKRRIERMLEVEARDAMETGDCEYIQEAIRHQVIFGKLCMEAKRYEDAENHLTEAQRMLWEGLMIQDKKLMEQVGRIYENAEQLALTEGSESSEGSCDTSEDLEDTSLLRQVHMKSRETISEHRSSEIRSELHLVGQTHYAFASLYFRWRGHTNQATKHAVVAFKIFSKRFAEGQSVEHGDILLLHRLIASCALASSQHLVRIDAATP